VPLATARDDVAVRRSAVIDMGSNSWRLVVYGFEPGRYWHHVDEIREAVRISAGARGDGTLRRGQIERAVHTAELFASFCRAARIDDVTAVATSAIREAPNRDDLLDEIGDRSGLEVRVISAEEEAWYGYLAIANSTTLADGLGLDMGGGSVQAMRIRGRRLEQSASWPLGAVRVSEAFLPEEEATPKQLKALRKHVRKQTAEADWLAGSDLEHAVGIGGAIRNLAAAAEKRAGLPYTDAQGFTLTCEALDELIETLAELPASERGGVPGIKPDRGDVILGAAVVLSELLASSRLDAIEASHAGLREGVFLERFLDDRDPPLFADVRRASVEMLANRYEDSLDHARHVAELSLEMYDRLAELDALASSDEDRQLLWAACMLHDIGTTVDYNDHHKHSRYLIMNAGLAGYTPRELELISLIARYHRKGDPDTSEMGPLERKGDAALLNLLAGIIRLAEQLERSRDGSVESVQLQASNGTVLLKPDTRADASVAIWSARRNSDLLSRALERRVEILD
jgi:exopolyphosphatase / guanosine-5'-triphosphate,3'-diphosphate pyrophosphatase